MRKIFIIALATIALQFCSKKSENPPPPGALQPAQPAAPAPTGAAQPAQPAAPAPAGVPKPAPAALAPMKQAATPGVPALPLEIKKDEKKDVLSALKAGQLQEYYNPAGKRDPFKPFEGGEIVYTAVAKAPLERFELNQLELTAIVWGIARPKVLFRAPDGYSYIAQVGSGVGRNRGKITKITKNRVLISEEFRDPSGQYVARESEFEMEAEQTNDKLYREMELKYSDE